MKTSLAPGSRVVTDYLDRAGLTPYLEKLGFALVGYGCTTCIGNSGPLIEEVGDRRRRGRPQRGRRALGEPELRGARAPAGARLLPGVAAARGRLRARRSRRHRPHDRAARRRVRTGPCSSPISGRRPTRSPRRSPQAVDGRAVPPGVRARSGTATSGGARSPTPDRVGLRLGPRLHLRARAAVLRRRSSRGRSATSTGARILVKVGDSITTDHISPAGSIKADSPAGRYLQEHGVRAARLQLLRRHGAGTTR